ncbi:hypothetical protein N9U75_03050 [Pelagibacteraceae bacterium]|nr:hypothetical protein [Pelagibacteraceae bacterium]
MKKKIDILIIIINIFFFLYYAVQLLVFTDEFAIANLGFFNHAVAGLSEIIGIIFATFIIGLITILYRGLHSQLPVIFSIFIFQLAASINFWRYVITDSPGETNIQVITSNAYIFTAITCVTFILFLRNFSKL